MWREEFGFRGVLGLQRDWSVQPAHGKFPERQRGGESHLWCEEFGFRGVLG